MTPEKVKALLPVLTAYAQGKTIQMKDCSGAGWIDLPYAKFDLPAEEYRVKPDPISLKYRRYIWKDDNGWHIASLSHDSDIVTWNVEKMSCFVRWIDTDWVTYECEV